MLKSSANRKRIRVFDMWTSFVLFLVHVRMCLVVIGGEIASKKEMDFFFVVATRLSRKTMCSITTKQHNCRFFVLERNIQNVAAGFALFTVVETSRFIG